MRVIITIPESACNAEWPDAGAQEICDDIKDVLEGNFMELDGAIKVEADAWK